MSNRAKVPKRIKERVLLESGLRCPVPRCAHDSELEIHHIDENASNNAPQNLLVLCAVHHAMAHTGRLSRNMCFALKQLLSEESPFLSSRSVVRLRSREEYLNCAIQELGNTRLSYRSVYVGPLFLHPAWYHRRRDKLFPMPNYDVAVRRFLARFSCKTCSDVRVILRNVGRYTAKIEQIVAPPERLRFKREVDMDILELWGQRGRRGPLICCVDTGFLRIPLIHDHSVIVASRRSEANQIESGYMFTRIDDIQRERVIYDSIFDETHRGQATEVENLRHFVSQLWTQC